MARPKGSPNLHPSFKAKKDLMRKLRGEADKGDPLAIGFVLLLEAINPSDVHKEDRRHG